MLENYKFLAPGDSLLSFNPGFMARSMRIDNPSGCWYRIKNNRQIVPPYTYGLTVVLQADSKSISVEFLTSFAGQQSKLVGDNVLIYFTDDVLVGQNPVDIQSAIPYINTFTCQALAITGVVGVDKAIWNILPTVNMRLRLTYFAIHFRNGAVALLTQFYINSLSAWNGAGVTTPVVRSMDSDAAVASQSTVREDCTGASFGTVLARLRTYEVDIPPVNRGWLSRSFDVAGPDTPPSIYRTSTTLRAIQVGMLAGGANVTVDGEIVWTEEPIT